MFRVLVIAAFVLATAQASWVCATQDIKYVWHTFVRHQGSCPSWESSCSSSNSLVQLTNIGFEKASWSPIGPGKLRDDSGSPCNSATFVGGTTTCGRKAIISLINKGWNTAIYNIVSGAFNCLNTRSDCSPSSLGNVCWDFTCSFQCQAKVSCPSSLEAETNRTAPAEWTCPLSAFNDGKVCDCMCGAADPDCENLNLPQEGCKENEVCLATGDRCEPRSTVLAIRKSELQHARGVNVFEKKHRPLHGFYNTTHQLQAAPGWSCPLEYYAAQDGCDCNCGAWDPDCDADQHVTNCPNDMETGYKRSCERKAPFSCINVGEKLE